MHGNQNEVHPAAVEGDFDIERSWKLHRVRAEKGPGFAEGVVALIDHAVDLFAEHAWCAEDLEAEFVGVPFEFEACGGHLSHGAPGPKNGRRVAAFEDGNHSL